MKIALTALRQPNPELAVEKFLGINQVCSTESPKGSEIGGTTHVRKWRWSGKKIKSLGWFGLKLFKKPLELRIATSTFCSQVTVTPPPQQNIKGVLFRHSSPPPKKKDFCSMKDQTIKIGRIILEMGKFNECIGMTSTIENEDLLFFLPAPYSTHTHIHTHSQRHWRLEDFANISATVRLGSPRPS